MVTFQDAERVVRELTGVVARAASGRLSEEDAVAAFEAGNRYLTDAGHEPVDAAAIDHEGDGDDTALVFVGVTVDDQDMTDEQIVAAALELLRSSGHHAGKLDVEQSFPAPERGIVGNLEIESAVWYGLEADGSWSLGDNGVKIHAETP